jgi:inorganic pyrophosphatase
MLRFPIHSSMSFGCDVSMNSVQDQVMIKVFIEAEARSRSKNRYDETTLEYQGTGRVALPYPYPYGFVLGTKAPDGDNVDCYVLTTSRLCTGTVVECEPVGLLQQEENGEIDDKVLATLPGQHAELNEGLLKVLETFIYGIFSWYPRTRVRVGKLLPREAALDYLRRSAPPRRISS